MFSGLRPSEICRMNWKDIDWSRDEIHVGKQKVRMAGVNWIDDGSRHSFESYQLTLLRDIARVSEETGTSASTLRNHYRRPISAEVAKKWFEIRPESGPKTPPPKKSKEVQFVAHACFLRRSNRLD